MEYLSDEKQRYGRENAQSEETNIPPRFCRTRITFQHSRSLIDRQRIEFGQTRCSKWNAEGDRFGEPRFTAVRLRLHGRIEAFESTMRNRGNARANSRFGHPHSH